MNILAPVSRIPQPCPYLGSRGTDVCGPRQRSRWQGQTGSEGVGHGYVYWWVILVLALDKIRVRIHHTRYVVGFACVVNGLDERSGRLNC